MLFASEIKTLAAVLPQTPSVHPPALIDFLGKEFNGEENTILEVIKRVLPVHSVTLGYFVTTAHRNDSGAWAVRAATEPKQRRYEK